MFRRNCDLRRHALTHAVGDGPSEYVDVGEEDEGRHLSGDEEDTLLEVDSPRQSPIHRLHSGTPTQELVAAGNVEKSSGEARAAARMRLKRKACYDAAEISDESEEELDEDDELDEAELEDEAELGEDEEEEETAQNLPKVGLLEPRPTGQGVTHCHHEGGEMYTMRPTHETRDLHDPTHGSDSPHTFNVPPTGSAFMPSSPSARYNPMRALPGAGESIHSPSTSNGPEPYIPMLHVRRDLHPKALLLSAGEMKGANIMPPGVLVGASAIPTPTQQPPPTASTMSLPAVLTQATQASGIAAAAPPPPPPLPPLLDTGKNLQQPLHSPLESMPSFLGSIPIRKRIVGLEQMADAQRAYNAHTQNAGLMALNMTRSHAALKAAPPPPHTLLPGKPYISVNQAPLLCESKSMLAAGAGIAVGSAHADTTTLMSREAAVGIAPLASASSSGERHYLLPPNNAVNLNTQETLSGVGATRSSLSPGSTAMTMQPHQQQQQQPAPPPTRRTGFSIEDIMRR